MTEKLRHLAYTRTMWQQDFDSISPSLLAFYYRDFRFGILIGALLNEVDLDHCRFVSRFNLSHLYFTVGIFSIASNTSL